MATRQYVTKSGDTWEWEETSESIKALNRLHDEMRKNKEKEEGNEKS